MSEAVELEPCPNPWCDRGERPPHWRRVPRYDPSGKRPDRFRVSCTCGVRAPVADTINDAIAAWNRRALTKTGGEPVAWRWREPDSTLWAATAHRHIADNLAADPHFEVQPLYASDGAGRPLVERTVVEIPPLTEEQRAYLEPLLRREPVDMSVVIGGPSAALSDGAGQVDGEG